ncbi:MAG: hypothetical protein KGN79_13450 [Acidobacteriota bacterium]|nr:hypothetical protein [Acidobacteriota bacterium]
MPLGLTMSVMSVAEFFLWATVGFLFWRRGLQERFPAMSTYLMLKVGSMPVLLSLLFLQAEPWGRHYFRLYFFGSWAVYIACAVSLYFVMMEVFRSALSAFTGLIRLGTVAFRWVAMASIIVSMSTMSFKHTGFALIPDIALGMMRSISILELCMLAFLCLCMNALKITVRDFTFGLSLGFGMLAANDFIEVCLIQRFPGQAALNAPIQVAYEGVILSVLTVWVAYCVKPVLARKPVTISANSTIYRWNEIAAALGHGTQVAVQQPSGSFFLADVEKVVDKVLTRIPSSETK